MKRAHFAHGRLKFFCFDFLPQTKPGKERRCVGTSDAELGCQKNVLIGSSTMTHSRALNHWPIAVILVVCRWPPQVQMN